MACGMEGVANATEGGTEGGASTASGMAFCSSVVFPASSPPGSAGGISGVGELGSGGGWAGGMGGTEGLSEERQQPLQSQPSRLVIMSQVKESLRDAHDSLRSQRRAHGSSVSWLAEAGGRKMTTATDPRSLVKADNIG